MNLPPEFIPEDWLTPALKAAQVLADDYLPHTDEQIALQSAMTRALRTCNLDQVKEALRLGRYQATRQWIKWHDAWLHIVERLLARVETDQRAREA